MRLRPAAVLRVRLPPFFIMKPTSLVAVIIRCVAVWLAFMSLWRLGAAVYLHLFASSGLVLPMGRIMIWNCLGLAVASGLFGASRRPGRWLARDLDEAERRGG